MKEEVAPAVERKEPEVFRILEEMPPTSVAATPVKRSQQPESLPTETMERARRDGGPPGALHIVETLQKKIEWLTSELESTRDIVKCGLLAEALGKCCNAYKSAASMGHGDIK